MKCRFFIIVSMILLGFSLAAQPVYQDVVLTKDGSTYKGTVIENRIDDYIKIEINGGSIIKVDYTNILALNKEIVSEAPKEAGSFSDENFYNAKAKLQGLHIKDLKKVSLQDLGIAAWSSSQKARLYDSLRHDDATLPFVLNLILPLGIGSYIQGDTDMGTYQLLSQLGFSLAALTGIGYSTTYTTGYSGYSYSYQQPNALFYILAINSSASYIAGLITPWTYQNNYNDALKSAIGY